MGTPGAEDAAPLWPEGSTAVAVSMAAVSETAGGPDQTAPPDTPLPALDIMVARIPAEVRGALDDLFRVKFTGVVRIPANSLKQ